jgi:hypothetical protein
MWAPPVGGVSFRGGTKNSFEQFKTNLTYRPGAFSTEECTGLCNFILIYIRTSLPFVNFEFSSKNQGRGKCLACPFLPALMVS